jgi:hypothetical protein
MIETDPPKKEALAESRLGCGLISALILSVIASLVISYVVHNRTTTQYCIESYVYHKESYQIRGEETRRRFYCYSFVLDEDKQEYKLFDKDHILLGIVAIRSGDSYFAARPVNFFGY